MDWRAAFFGIIMFGTIAVLSGIASRKVGDADMDGAIAVAIEQHVSGWLGVESLEKSDSFPAALKFCLESDVPLKIDHIASALSHTMVRPIPMKACRSEKVEGDFGMFTAITRYYDATGEQVGHLEIVRVTCSTTTSCLVDIDDFGAGMRYEMKREGSVWRAVKYDLRWIV